MKKLILAAAVAAFATSAMATDGANGTVNFRGKVTDQTCSIKTDSQNQTVVLNTVPKSALDTAQKTAMPTPFEIKLENCKAPNESNTVKKVKAFFHGDNVDTEHNYTLKNTANTNKAENVNIQLLNEDGTTVITPSAAGPATVRGEAGNGVNDGVIPTEIKADNLLPVLHYVARYYATGVASEGDVTSSINFNLAYE